MKQLSKKNKDLATMFNGATTKSMRGKCLLKIKVQKKGVPYLMLIKVRL